MTRREGILLRVATALVLTALIARVGPRLVEAESSLRERVDAKLAERARMGRDLASLDSLEREAPALRTALIELAPQLLAGTTDAEATGDLSSRLRSLAEGLGAQVERVQALPDTLSVAPLRRVGLDLEFLCDFQCLTDLLARTGHFKAPFGLTRIRITSLNDAAASSPESLRVVLSFSGWYLPPGIHQ